MLLGYGYPFEIKHIFNTVNAAEIHFFVLYNYLDL